MDKRTFTNVEWMHIEYYRILFRNASKYLLELYRKKAKKKDIYYGHTNDFRLEYKYSSLIA